MKKNRKNGERKMLTKSKAGIEIMPLFWENFIYKPFISIDREYLPNVSSIYPFNVVTEHDLNRIVSNWIIGYGYTVMNSSGDKIPTFNFARYRPKENIEWTFTIWRTNAHFFAVDKFSDIADEIIKQALARVGEETSPNNTAVLGKVIDEAVKLFSMIGKITEKTESRIVLPESYMDVADENGNEHYRESLDYLGRQKIQ